MFAVLLASVGFALVTAGQFPAAAFVILAIPLGWFGLHRLRNAEIQPAPPRAP